MNIARSIDQVRLAVRDARVAGAKIGFVPTMGFLHEGHLSLVDLARERGASFVVASIFVNPLQFAPGEDFDRYPRDEERDAALLEGRGTDLLFLPDAATMYPAGSASRVTVSGVSAPLEGARRPGHFDGVATVVLKLFNIVQPDLAAFGQKDAQQVAVIRQMVRDLDLPVEIVVGETRRDHDGLALSSRNAYLSPDERATALALPRALAAGRDAIEQGAREVASVERAMHETAVAYPGVEIDYLALVDPRTFAIPEHFEMDLLLTGAIRVGRTRLIDNLPVPAAVAQTASTVAASPERTQR